MLERGIPQLKTYRLLSIETATIRVYWQPSKVDLLYDTSRWRLRTSPHECNRTTREQGSSRRSISTNKSASFQQAELDAYAHTHASQFFSSRIKLYSPHRRQPSPVPPRLDSQRPGPSPSPVRPGPQRRPSSYFA